jgi:hypothetical protein
MLKAIKNSRFTNLIAVIALVISLLSAGLLISDAYAGKTSVLATVLQSVGLCEAPEEKEKPIAVPKPAATETAKPNPLVSPSAPSAETGKPVPQITANPSESPLKGVAGSPGIVGSAGTTGSSGADGATGATGASGATGAQGPAGVCDIAELLSVDGDLVPAVDNTYSLGTISKRWKSLQLGPGTLWIQDSEVTPPTQVGLTVKSGALLLDGADSLRIGNMRLTATGLTSINPASPITLGDNSFTNYVELQAGGIKFKDGTLQSTAATGVVGPPGPTGPQGPRGRDGSIEGFIEVPVCIIEDSPVYAKFTMVYSKCGEIEGKGRDIVILERKE